MKTILMIILTALLSGVSFVASAQTITGVIDGVPYTIGSVSNDKLDPSLREPPEVEEVPEKSAYLASEYANELEARMRKNGSLSVKMYLEKPINEDVSVYVSAYKSRGWSEFTFGPVIYITPELSVGAGVGTSYYMGISDEKEKYHTTLSGFVYYKTKEWEAELLAERYRKDPDAPFYGEAYIQKKVTESLWLGLYGDTDLGWGPRLSYEVSNRVSVWFTPLAHRKGETTAVFGVKFAF
jgi:hypothetical protein